MSLRDQMRQNAAPVSGGGDFPPDVKWDTPGKEVCGVIRDMRFIESGAQPDWVIEIDDEQVGPVTVWCSPVALKGALIQGSNQIGRRVQPGDQVYIRFDGKQNTDRGNTMNIYSVFVQSGSPGAVAAPAQPAPQQQPAVPPVQPQPAEAVQAPMQQPPQAPQQAAPQQPPAGQQWGQQAAPQQWPGQQAPTPTQGEPVPY